MLGQKIDLREIFHGLKQRRQGIVSICSVNEFVLESTLRFQKQNETFILIESTANQVNHYGGYSNLTPSKFRDTVLSLARKYGVHPQRLIIGVDHAGPWPWLKLEAHKAMEEAKRLVAECVKAGYKKIHLDTSYKLLGDASWDRSVIAKRQAELCFVAEEAYKDISGEDPVPPVYVLGTDVPPPGGSTSGVLGHLVSIGTLEEDLDMVQYEFFKLGLKDAWNRVVGYVMHSGADFRSFDVIPYDSGKLDHLKPFLSTFPYALEAHSTDYQKLECLQSMVRDGFAILKVGPELTFRFREAIFALCNVEKEVVNLENQSHLIETIVSEMKANPKYWEVYYHGEEIELKFSLYDRIRYYWSNEKVKEALNKLLMNLQNVAIPASLIHQYCPDINDDLSGITVLDPIEVIYSKIKLSLERYHKACKADFGVN